MENQQPTSDPFDTDLHTLFAEVHPAAGFEDRLVNAVRVQRRWSIPAPIRRAALAAAAVLVVGSAGYYGNMAITGGVPFGGVFGRGEAMNEDIRSSRAAQGPIVGQTAGLPPQGDAASKIVQSVTDYGLRENNYDHLANNTRAREANPWDFGGGSTTAQNWVNWNGTAGISNKLSYSYQNPFTDRAGVATRSRSTSSIQLGVAPDFNPFTGTQHDNIYTKAGGKAEVNKSLGKAADKTTSPYDHTDSILLPYAGTDDGAPIAPAAKPAPTTPAFKPADESKSAFAGASLYSRSGHGLSGGRDATVLAGNVSGLNYFHGNANGNFGVPPVLSVSGGPSTISIDTLPSSKTAGDGPQLDQALREMSDKSAEIEKLQSSITAGRAGVQIVGANPIDSNGKTPDGSSNQIGAGGQEQPVAGVPTTAPVIDARKIIRSGTMEFEVDRFDTAQMQITKIVGEAGGFVGATDSTKLPNGKVRGTISLRIPPDRLDNLVLSLRALGDLKSQQIVAADITREYTDLQSELTADRAMQDRLLELIHNGKGSVKDLLAAENELGTWRTKIEKAEGELRYDDGMVAMSTLSITLSERDIHTPATAIETETADMGIEAEDVEKSRNTAMKAIDEAKGRIVAAELKRYDAGQLAAQITADIPPEAAGALIDQLKLLGKVARLEIHRQETTSDGSNTVTGNTPLRTEQKPTRLLISIYNLANVAPRRTTNINLAAADVETAFNALIAEAKTDGGRVVTSSLDRGDPVKATGTIVLEIPPAKLEASMAALRAQGDVLKLTLTENADTQNSTEAKHGLTVQLVSLASVPARESVQQSVAAVDVPTAYQSILNAATTAHARVLTAQLNEQDRQNVSAELQFEVLRSALPALDKAIAATGDTISRTSGRAADADGTVDSKVQLKLSISSADHLAPRETTRLQSEVPDVDKAAGDAQAVAISLGGRVIEATITKDHGKGVARVALDVPLDKSQEALRQIRQMGVIHGIDASRDTQAPAGPLAHAQIFVEFSTGDTLVTDDTGPWASMRHGLSTSINALLWSLQWVVVGICLIGPFALIGWIVAKLWRWHRGKVRSTV